jgi:hypothetical protein
MANTIFLTGTLTSNPKRFKNSETTVAGIFLKCRTDANGEIITLPITLFGKEAEKALQEGCKGDYVSIEGFVKSFFPTSDDLLQISDANIAPFRLQINACDFSFICC